MSCLAEREAGMVNSMEDFTEKQQNDMKVLIAFIDIYCKTRHKKDKKPQMSLKEAKLPVKDYPVLCDECALLASYAIGKLRECPLSPKPSCKKCPIHCYSKEYRAKMKEVMAFSGKRMILRGRLDLLWHYLF